MSRYLVALAFVAACSDPTGALLVVEGSVQFDQVEMYSGDTAGNRVPTTPLHARTRKW